MGARTRCLGVDDHPVVRQGLALLFNGNSDVELVGTVKTGEEALEAIEKLQPQVVVMDVRLPGIDGPEATRRILADSPGIRVILLSTYEAADLPDLEHCGASRFVRKQDLDADDLLA